MSLKFEEIELLARQAGFSPDQSPIMAAIALGESGGDPGIDTVMSGLDPNRTNEYSIGLTQVNAPVHSDKLRRRGFTENDLRDPLKNLQIAKDVFDEAGQSFQPWSVFKHGLYKNHLPNSFTPLEGSNQSQLPTTTAKPNTALQRMAGLPLGGEESPLAIAVSNISNAVYGGEPSDTPGRMAMSTPMPAMSSTPSTDGLSIVDLGTQLQGMGFKVAEHPQFGGVGQHSPRSHHYAGHALDLTIQPGSALLDGRPDSDWSDLTSQYGAQLRAQFPQAEIFYRDHDPVGGHSEHIHIAFPGGVYRRG